MDYTSSGYSGSTTQPFLQSTEQARPILARHGVHVERWLMTESLEGKGMDRPDQIVVTWFADSGFDR